MLLAGVDFSCSPSRRKPITLATGRLVGTRLVARRVAELTTLAAFETGCVAPGPWLGGFDFPFGLPRAFVDAHGFGASCGGGDRERAQSLRDAHGLACLHRRLGQYATGRRAPAASAHRRRFAGDVDQPDADALRSGRADVLRRRRAPDRLRRDVARPARTAATRRGSRSRRIRAGSRMRSSRGARTRTARWTIDVARVKRSSPGSKQAATASASRSRATPALRASLIDDVSGDRLDAVLCLAQAAIASRRDRYGLPPTSTRSRAGSPATSDRRRDRRAGNAAVTRCA